MFLATVLGAAIGVSACGGDEPPAPLVWERAPTVTVPDRLRDDRVLSGRIRNASGDAVDLDAADLTVRDADGRPMDGTGIYLASFAHGLYPPSREPEEVGEGERRRTGREASIDPGRSVAVTVAWRERRGAAPAVSIDYGGGALPVPR